MQKLLVAILAIAANMVFVWYANKTGKIGDAGTFLGWQYDSRLVSSFILSFKYILILAVANAIFTFASKSGIEAFGSFLPFILIWIAAYPVAALLFNTFVNKEPLNGILLLGLTMIFLGSVLVSSHKEIIDVFK